MLTVREMVELESIAEAVRGQQVEVQFYCYYASGSEVSSSRLVTQSQLDDLNRIEQERGGPGYWFKVGEGQFVRCGSETEQSERDAAFYASLGEHETQFGQWVADQEEARQDLSF